MKALLHKLFGPVEYMTKDRPQSIPRPLSIHSLFEHQRRAMIGWIANRMGELLQVENSDSGELIYISFFKENMNENKKSAVDYIMYLASCLFGWLEEGQDVYLQIKEMHLSDKHHKCVLDVYEEIKADINCFLPNKQDKPAERNAYDAVWEVYRDVIHAATQKKFLLIRSDEVDPYMQGNVICEASIKERSDIPNARDSAKQSLLDNGVPASNVMSHLLVISEAITNILKHAKEGKLTIIRSETSVHVVVKDSGPGFPLKLLPYTTLMAGYSTKKSMGQGFTLMMKMTQQVLLSTVPNEGSTLILIFQSKERNVKK